MHHREPRYKNTRRNHKYIYCRQPVLKAASACTYESDRLHECKDQVTLFGGSQATKRLKCRKSTKERLAGYAKF